MGERLIDVGVAGSAQTLVGVDAALRRVQIATQSDLSLRARQRAESLRCVGGAINMWRLATHKGRRGG